MIHTKIKVTFVKNDETERMIIIKSRVVIWLGLIEVFYCIFLSDSIESILSSVKILAKGSKKAKNSLSLSILR